MKIVRSFRPVDEAVGRAVVARVRQELRATGGNMTETARRLGRNRTEFYRLAARFGLSPVDFAECAPRINGAVQEGMETLKKFKVRVEKGYWSLLLRTTEGNVERAAAMGRRARTHLYRRLKELEINPNAFRQQREEKAPAEAPLQ